MESRSSSPSPGQSGQDDRDDDADSASGRQLAPVHDESLDSDCEAESNNRPDEEISSGVSGSDARFNEAQPGSSSSSVASQRGNVSGSFQVMMMADDLDDDDLDEDESNRNLFAASSSSSTQPNLRRSPYLSSSTNAFRGSSSSNNEVDMATFSPQPSSSGLNSGHLSVPTTSSIVSSEPKGISSSSSVNQLSSTLHGEISNPPSPLGGRAGPLNPSQRPDSPQAGPSGAGLKRPIVSASTSSSSSSSKQRRQSLDAHPGPSGSHPGPSRRPQNQPQRSSGGGSLTFMAAAAAAMASNSGPGPSNSGPGPSNSGPGPSNSGPGPSNSGPGPSNSNSNPVRIQPQIPNSVNLNVSSSEAVPIDNGSDDEDENIVNVDPADNYLISSSTGIVNSVPSTPMDAHGDGDLSVPSPSNNVLNQRPSRPPRLDVDDMIDSTVDSSGYSNLNQRSSNDSNEGPVQSSHYEDSSDDDSDAQEAFSRQNSHVESGISTSGQVDEGQFRLVPNNIEDEQFNQYNPPRSQAQTSVSSSSANLSSAPLTSPSENNHIFCEPGPSRQANSRPVNGSNSTSSSTSNNRGLDYELDALDNFPDPSPGDFDPSNSLSSSFPPIVDSVELEDIQVQNLEQVDKYLNNNAKDSAPDQANSGPPSLGNIGLAFSRIPGSKASSSSSNLNSHHSSILESMTGPLSKRLRTLHTLQQQQSSGSNAQVEQNPVVPKVNGKGGVGKKSSNNNNNNGEASKDAHEERSSYDPEPDQDPGSAGSSNNIQTFSVTIETVGNLPMKPKKFFQQKSANEDLFNVIHPLSDEKPPENNLAMNRSRRHIKKRKMYYCDQCRMEYESSECPLHQPVLLQITDQPIMSRAQASLPSGYLSLRPLNAQISGVFARKTIPKLCRFGPLEGRETNLRNIDDIILDDDLTLVLLQENGQIVKLDVSDEEESNWMRFVRPASRYSEQNLILTQDKDRLYFTSTRTISPRQELRVWYSPEYAKIRGLRVHQPTPQDLVLEDDINSWPCFECNRGFSSSEELQKHLNEHENIAPNPAGGPQMIKNQEKMGKIRHKCPICPRFFDRTYSLQRHVALHKGEKKFKCDECGAKYSLRFNLNRHKRRVHNSDPKGNYTRCEICGLWFRISATYRIHVLSHSQDQNRQQNFKQELKCPQCNSAKFLGWNQFVEHATNHGERVLPLQPLEQEAKSSEVVTQLRKPHKCELCYKSFSTEERLTKHMAVHGSDENKPLACEECGKRFLSNSALACHLKVHATEMFSYDCPICNQPFDQIHALKEHVHVHRINNKYTCPHCHKEFSEYALIRKHIRAFHAAKRFQCAYCEKAFTGSDKLKAHLVKHSDKREFLCNECGKTFKRKDKLKEHAKRIHSKERKAQQLHSSESSEAANPRLVINEEPIEDQGDKFIPRVSPTDYHRFIYKCHKCLLGFKRRGMLVNHLAKRHPDVSLETVPELNLPILKTTKDYFCQYCNKVYKSSSKRKSHILKNHPGKEPPPSARDKAALAAAKDNDLSNPTFSATVGSVTSQPHNCPFCHKQYATNAKLLQHQRKEHQGQKRPQVQNLVTVNGQEIGISDDTFRPQQPQNQENLEYQVNGEVLQLTRVPQAEAMRLVNSGATVIHVADGQPGPSGRNLQHLQPQNQPQNSPRASYDLPAELVWVNPNEERPQQQNNPGNEWINAYRRNQN